MHPEAAVAFDSYEYNASFATKEVIAGSMPFIGMNYEVGKFLASDQSGRKKWVAMNIYSDPSQIPGSYVMPANGAVIIEGRMPALRETGVAHAGNPAWVDLSTGQFGDVASDWGKLGNLSLTWCYITPDEKRRVFGLFTRYAQGSRQTLFCELRKSKQEWETTGHTDLSRALNYTAASTERSGIAGIAGNTAVIATYQLEDRRQTHGGTAPVGCPLLTAFDTDEDKEIGHYRLLAYRTEEDEPVFALSSADAPYPAEEYDSSIQLISATGAIPQGARLAKHVHLYPIRAAQKDGILVAAINASFNEEDSKPKLRTTGYALLDLANGNIQNVSSLDGASDRLTGNGEYRTSEFEFAHVDPVGDEFGNVYFIAFHKPKTNLTYLIKMDAQYAFSLIDNDTLASGNPNCLVSTGSEIWYLKRGDAYDSTTLRIAGGSGNRVKLIRYDPLTGEKKVVHEADDIRFLTASIY
jgi:hypothetical protein